jgi:hypothetical protein
MERDPSIEGHANLQWTCGSQSKSCGDCRAKNGGDEFQKVLQHRAKRHCVLPNSGARFSDLYIIQSFSIGHMVEKRFRNLISCNLWRAKCGKAKGTHTGRPRTVLLRLCMYG